MPMHFATHVFIFTVTALNVKTVEGTADTGIETEMEIETETNTHTHTQLQMMITHLILHLLNRNLLALTTTIVNKKFIHLYM